MRRGERENAKETTEKKEKKTQLQRQEKCGTPRTGKGRKKCRHMAPGRKK